MYCSTLGAFSLATAKIRTDRLGLHDSRIIQRMPSEPNRQYHLKVRSTHG